MKRLLLLILLFPLLAHAGGCDKYQIFHSTQAHNVSICECTSCHLGSLNKGTAPTTCIGCHMGARPAAPQKPASHINTSSIGCENCHGVTSFLGSHMNHSVVSGQSCNSCHGVSPSARGKPSDHVQTSADCGTCHLKTSSWDAKMNHTGIVTGCSSCHSRDKDAGHIPTTASCETCHSGFTSWTGGRYTHTGAENCATCHATAGINATQKTATHPVTTANCLTCHSGTTTFSCAMNDVITKFANYIRYLFA